jgi:hypothetical protein
MGVRGVSVRAWVKLHECIRPQHTNNAPENVFSAKMVALESTGSSGISCSDPWV